MDGQVLNANVCQVLATLAFGSNQNTGLVAVAWISCDASEQIA